jgi:DNA-binding transcriptional ArsR family regulator
MQDVVYIEDVERAGALLKPRRVELLRLLAEPHSLGELSSVTGETPQKLYYHVKVLERAELVQQVGERPTGVMVEAIYQAVARSYWLAPQVIDQAGGRRRATDDLSLGFLLGLAEEVQRELGHLAGQAVLGDVPSLGLDLHVHLPAELREAFAGDVQRMFRAIAEKYGIRDDSAGEPFRVVLACYPGDPGT